MTIRFMNQWRWKPNQRVWSSLFHYKSGLGAFDTWWVLIGVFGFFLYVAAQHEPTR